MEITYSITLRLSTATSKSSLFNTVQGDVGTRKIQATILEDDGTAFSPGSGVTAEYWSRKADGTGTQHSSGVSISGNVVTVILTEQDLAAAGRTYAAIVLKKGTEVLAAMPFWFFNAPIPVGEDFESSNDYQSISDATDAANEAADNANEAASHGPYIDPNTYYWYVWDAEKQKYVNTYVVATGAVEGAVLYVQQTLSDASQLQARKNIDAASDTDLRAGTYETRGLHLGFYLDDDGYVCQG